MHTPVPICHDCERAHRISQLLYSIYVGSQHILPPVQGHELEALYQEVGGSLISCPCYQA